MSKQLSLTLLMVIAAMYGCVVALANLTFQLKSYEIDREFAMSAHWVSLGLQVIFAPLLIRLSDSIGRNAVITISFAGVLIGVVNLLFANSLMMLSIGHVIMAATGTGGGCFNAYCSDQSSKNRAEIFLIVEAAWALGFVCSTIIYDNTLTLGDNDSVYVSILMTIVGGVLTLFVLPNSLDHNNRTPFVLREANLIGASKALFANRAMTMLTISMLLFFTGIRGYAYIQQMIFSMRHGGMNQVAGIITAQQLSTVLIAILAFVFILSIGKTRTVVVTFIISMIGIAGILYAPIQLERIVLFMPYIGNIGGAILLAMMVDRTSPNRYGVIFAGITGLTIITELIASGNQQLFEYFEETSPQNLFLCAVIPAMILLTSLIVFLSIPKKSLGEVS
jgi:DHA1 family tetracycline resistance protein-like MFS transporter